VGDPSYLA